MTLVQLLFPLQQKLLLVVWVIPLICPMIALGESSDTFVSHLDVPKAISLLQQERRVTFKSILGQGSFGCVVSGMTPDGELRAFKLLPLNVVVEYDGVQYDGEDLLWEEVTNMILANSSESVVRYYDRFILNQSSNEAEKVGVIEMELITGDTLFAIVQDSIQKNRLNTKTALWLFGNAAVSIHKMHLAGVYHYDMNVGNFLVEAHPLSDQPDQVEVRRVVVSDFGMAGTSPGPIAPYDTVGCSSFVMQNDHAAFSLRDFQRFCRITQMFGELQSLPTLVDISKACLKRFMELPDEHKVDPVRNAEIDEAIVRDFKAAAVRHGVKLDQALRIPSIPVTDWILPLILNGLFSIVFIWGLISILRKIWSSLCLIVKKNGTEDGDNGVTMTTQV